jgi:hypothetical protein
MTQTEMQDIVLKHLTEAVQDTITIRERISDAFMTWFQSLVEVPQIEVANEEAEGEAPPPEEGAPA